MSFMPKQSNTGHRILYECMQLLSQTMFYLSCKTNRPYNNTIIGPVFSLTLTLILAYFFIIKACIFIIIYYLLLLL